MDKPFTDDARGARKVARGLLGHVRHWRVRRATGCARCARWARPFARALTASCVTTCSEIWDALKAACGADIETARLICDAACVIVPSGDLRTAYDERGALYELPPYVLSPPTNLVRA